MKRTFIGTEAIALGPGNQWNRQRRLAEQQDSPQREGERDAFHQN